MSYAVGIDVVDARAASLLIDGDSTQALERVGDGVGCVRSARPPLCAETVGVGPITEAEGEAVVRPRSVLVPVVNEPFRVTCVGCDYTPSL